MTPPGEELSVALDREELLEALAAVEHERWSHWQRYLHSKCISNADGSLTIPAVLVSRWAAQMMTPYGELSDSEKESDREQVRATLQVIRAAILGLE